MPKPRWVNLPRVAFVWVADAAARARAFSKRRMESRPTGSAWPREDRPKAAALPQNKFAQLQSRTGRQHGPPARGWFFCVTCTKADSSGVRRRRSEPPGSVCLRWAGAQAVGKARAARAGAVVRYKASVLQRERAATRADRNESVLQRERAATRARCNESALQRERAATRACCNASARQLGGPGQRRMPALASGVAHQREVPGLPTMRCV